VIKLVYSFVNVRASRNDTIQIRVALCYHVSPQELPCKLY
jgi:hypothetical protein